MQLYQKRDFGALISDTFLFFKEHGKSYFKNYLAVNGLLVLLLVALVLFGLSGFVKLFGQTGREMGSPFIENYFAQNEWYFIISTLFFSLLLVVVYMISFLFPVFYMKRIAEKAEEAITHGQIIDDLKKRAPRFFFFILGMIFIVLPLFFVLFGISVLLTFILIGFIVLLFLGPACMNVMNFLLFDYFQSQETFFSSLRYAVLAQFSYENSRAKTPFWKYWGATVIMYVIIQTAISVVSMVPLLILISRSVVLRDVPAGNDLFTGTSGILMLVFYGISVLLSFLMMNVIMVCSGLQYYDSRTDLHQSVSLSEIDAIGRHA